MKIKPVISRWAVGLSLIALGIGWLLEVNGHYAGLVRDMLGYWPLLPIALGVDYILIGFNRQKNVEKDSDMVRNPSGGTIAAIVVLTVVGIVGGSLLNDLGSDIISLRRVVQNVDNVKLSSDGPRVRSWRTTVNDNTSYTYTLDGTNSVKIDDSLGNVTVNVDPNLSGEVKVDAEIVAGGRDTAEAQRYLDKVSVNGSVTGNALVITTEGSGPAGTYDYAAAVNMNLTVPQGTSITIEDGYGYVIIHDPINNLDLWRKAGRIEIDEIIGNANIYVSAGDVDLGTIRKNADINVSAGKVAIDSVDGDLTCGASAGEVVVGTVKGKASVNASMGAVRIDNALGKITATSSMGEVNVSISKLGGDVDLSASMGNVVLTLPSDARFDVDASVSMGKIDNDFPGSSSRSSSGGINQSLKTAVNGGGYKVKLGSSMGSIAIRRR